MKRWLIVFFVFWAAPVIAADIEIQPGITQQMFKDFSQEAASVLLYRAVEPAAPLGLLGFDIGVEATATKIDNGADFWKKAVKNQDPPSYIVAPKVHLQKGLPLGFDVGLVYSKVPDTNIQYAGGEVKYAILKGGAVWPALAVRGSYSQLFGVDQLDFKSYGLEFTVSKGFGVGVKIIPYVGVGQYWFESKPKNLSSGISLNDESFSLTRGVIGGKLQLGFFAVTAEADYVRVPSYTLRVGITW